MFLAHRIQRMIKLLDDGQDLTRIQIGNPARYHHRILIGGNEPLDDLLWKQVESKVRGETSLDAWESRKLATVPGPDAEKYKNEYFAATFADAISIYLLSLFLDMDYHDLRERDYPLLAPQQMAERLRKVAELFPANPGFEFAVYYKRRT